MPFEWGALGNPDVDAKVLTILDDIAKGIGVSSNNPRADGRHVDTETRTNQLQADLRGWFGADKAIKRRTPYCAVAMPSDRADREHLKRVLRRIRELVPPLIFIELCPESQTREEEVFFMRCLSTRLESERKRRTR